MTRWRGLGTWLATRMPVNTLEHSSDVEQSPRNLLGGDFIITNRYLELPKSAVPLPPVPNRHPWSCVGCFSSCRITGTEKVMGIPLRPAEIFYMLSRNQGHSRSVRGKISLLGNSHGHGFVLYRPVVEVGALSVLYFESRFRTKGPAPDVCWVTQHSM